MKTTKIILLIATISFFISIPTSAEAARDCSQLTQKGFHAKLMCKLGSNKYSVNKSSSTTQKVKKVKRERCKTFVECWKRRQEN